MVIGLKSRRIRWGGPCSRNGEEEKKKKKNICMIMLGNTERTTQQGRQRQLHAIV
jgi:hypothetical protein